MTFATIGLVVYFSMAAVKKVFSFNPPHYDLIHGVVAAITAVCLMFGK